MRLQIVGGRWRGRVITAPPIADLRPTSHKVREAIFDLLGARVQGAAVLELFAGSGALGLEAVSRGAASVVFVDRAPECTAAIRRTLAAFDLPPGVSVEILTQEALTAIRRLSRAGRRFDLILADPPYAHPSGDEAVWGKKSLRVLGGHAILAPSGAVVLEHAGGVILPPCVEASGGRPLEQRRLARYGDTAVAFYE